MKVIRPAATVILLRKSHNTGFEVLLLQRSKTMSFAGGFWVFPGGVIDTNEYDANHNILDPHNVLMLESAKRAARREALEECSITLNTDGFVYYSHWITPTAEAKRFSTWFLIAEAPIDNSVTVDDTEITKYQWLTPDKALEKFTNGELRLMPPTYMTLRELSDKVSIEDALQYAVNREVPAFFPKLFLNENPPQILYEGDAGYEAGDVHAKGTRHRLLISDTGYEYIKDLI